MSYVLEAESEFERLERQSKHPSFNYQHELRELFLPPGGVVLDAGSGSGVVCRYLADTYPKAKVVGCDISDQRIALAQKAAKNLKNVSFQKENITALTFEDQTFDAVVCRYVLQHLDDTARIAAIREFERVLKPGGQIYLVDTDALLTTLYPQTPLVATTLSQFVENGPVDFYVGRKLPSLLAEAGFEKINWLVDITTCTGEFADAEIQMMRERFENANSFFVQILGSAEKAAAFAKEYIDAMASPGGVYYQNKFVVSGYKSARAKLKLVD